MDQLEIKRRIEKRFLKKNTGHIIIRIKDTKLRVTYMYGNKYCLQRKVGKGKAHVVEMLHDIDKISELIKKEYERGNSNGNSKREEMVRRITLQLPKRRGMG